MDKAPVLQYNKIHDLYDRLSRAWLRVMTGEKEQGLEEMRELLEGQPPPVGLVQDFVTDTELLAQAPHPPEGVEEVLALLREVSTNPVS